MNSTLRKNIGVQIGEWVQIRIAVELPYLKKIKVKALEKNAKSNEFVEKFLIPYFKDAYRPVKLGEKFNIRNENYEDFWF